MLGIPPGISVLFSTATRRRIALAVLGSVVAAALEVLGVAAVLPLMQLITGSDPHTGMLGRISSVFGNPPNDRLAGLIAGVVFFAFVVKALFTIAFRWWLIGFLVRQETDTSVALLRSYLGAPYWVHLQRNTASFVRTMVEAVSQTYSLVVTGAISVLTEVVTVLALAVVLVVVDPVPAIAALLYFLIAGLVFERSVRGRSVRAGEVFQDASLEMNLTAWQALQGIKEIKVRRNAEFFAAGYERASRQYAQARRYMAFLTDLPRYILELVFIVGIAMLTLLSMAQGNSTTTLTTLSLFVAAGFRMLPSLTRIIASTQMIRIGRKGVELLLEDVTASPLRAQPVDDPRSTKRLRPSTAVSIEHVTYRYPGTDVDVLHDVSVSIPAGHSVAFVGSSGAGKSTLVDIILGLHAPQRGEVRVDGVPIDSDLATWQRSLGLVPQDVYLIDDTLAANIAFGEPAEEVDQDLLREAVDRAQLRELVDSLPLGLDTDVGERGARLSGGQRQRIGIARALYRRPAVLVLDEATSALDNETERRIAQTIEGLAGEMTIVIVAHRLSTVRNSDEVVFLHDGRVEAGGTFEEVRASCPEFAHLVALGSLDPQTVPGEGGGHVG